MPSLSKPAAALLVAVFGLAGCGGGGRTATVGGTGAITVRMDEYRFDPLDIVARPGHLVVTVVNDGAVAHNWKVYRRPSGALAGGTRTFQAHRRQTVRLNLRPGRYLIKSTVGDDDDLGMRGNLRVEDRSGPAR